MYAVHFRNRSEVRMGSPYNVAEVELTGEFVPQLRGASFQDKAAVSSDGKLCYLIEWSVLPENRPGFLVWQISSSEHKVRRSSVIEGCCDAIEVVDGGVSLRIWRDGQIALQLVSEFE